jgi:hypothetical protein
MIFDTNRFPHVVAKQCGQGMWYFKDVLVCTIKTE